MKAFVKSLNVLLFSLLLTLCLNLRAQIRLSPLFTDHMVLQQQSSVPVWGQAEPGADISVKPSWSAVAETTRADAEGRWSVMLMTPDGSFRKRTIEISAESSRPRKSKDTLTISDVLIGEVWLCSGQSNMQMPMESWQAVRINQEDIASSGQYPNLRLLQVSRATGMSERDRFTADFGGWQPSSPETVRNFSAIAWYFGRKLQEQLKVPVGLIHSSWGGTIIEAWMSTGAIRQFPECAEQLAEVQSLSEDANEREKTYWGEMMKLMQQSRDEDEGLKAHWEKPALDDSGWTDIVLPKMVQELWPGVNGVYWFRKEIYIPASWAGQDLTLSLGPIDDFDETFWNGVPVGRDSVWNVPRTYTIPASEVKPGKAVIAIRNTDDHGNGGLYGDGAQMYVQGPDGQKISLATTWRVKLSVSFEYIPRNTAREPNLPTVLDNGMVKPLSPYRIAGVIWYQGESNAGKAARYRDQMPTMIRDWRRTWGYDFPFYITQIANHHAVQPEPAESSWAELREAQSLTALHMSGVEQACIIDLGEADDVHPVRKQEAGERLARLALAHQYGRFGLVADGPRMCGYEFLGDGRISVIFTDVANGLCTRSSGSYVEARYGKAALSPDAPKAVADRIRQAEDGVLTGFEVAGPDGVWHWAEAEIVSVKKPNPRTQEVIVSCPEVKDPVAVRYAWADNPVCNLYNSAGLPAWPFRTDGSR